VRSAWRSHGELLRWLGRDAFVRRRTLRTAALVVATLALALCFTRAAEEPPRLTDSGLDAVLLMDVSRSMGSTDTAPSRLRRAVQLAARTVAAADGSRFGLVLFAGDAFVALPLTHDVRAVTTYLNALDTEMISHRGSDLASALDAGRRVFDPRSRRARRIILMSDGEHAGTSLEQAATALRADGVRVTAVGFGALGGTPVPNRLGRSLYDENGREAISSRVDPTLERIARESGGEYFIETEMHPGPADLLPATVPSEARPPEPTPRAPEILLVLALALLAFEFSSSIRSRRIRPAGRLLLATALISLTLLGVKGADWLSEGDRLLASGDALSALTVYRRTERTHGTVPETRIRIGNALFRLGEHGRAAGAYLDALRELPLEAAEQRFTANFNLGDALLEMQRYAEARDAFWTAILDRPDSLEAVFNYEWAQERAPPEEFPEMPSPPSDAPEPTSEGQEGEERRIETVPARSEGRPQGELTREEAERWMASLEERVQAPLKRQISDQIDPTQLPAPRGQAW
jgi:Ca-activated chloride channel family protein